MILMYNSRNRNEILSKQLPLLTMVEPALKHTSDPSLPSRQSHKDRVNIDEKMKESSVSQTDKDKAESTECVESRPHHVSKYKGRLEESEVGFIEGRRNKDRPLSSESGSSIKDKERSLRQESSSSMQEHSKKEESLSRSYSASNRKDDRNKERSPRPESGSSKDDHRKERSSSSDSASNRKDDRNKERSPRPESGSSKDDHRKERSSSSDSASNRKDDRNKERSPRPESGSNKDDHKKKERSSSSESASNRKDDRNKERSPRPESGSSKDDHRKERSSSSDSASNRKDNRNKERSPRPESGSSKDDHKKKERSSSSDSASNRKDDRNKEWLPRPESSSSKDDHRKKERSSSSNSASNRKDDRNKERSSRPESSSSKDDHRKKERSSSSDSASNRKDNRNKERSPRPESGSNKDDHRKKERSSRLSLDSISEEEIKFDEKHISDNNSKKQEGISCPHTLSKVTGSKENMPPVMPGLMSKAVSDDCPVSKSSKPLANDLPVLTKPHIGKMIRRPATCPKSILAKSRDCTKKPGRRVKFTLPEKSPIKNQVSSRLARRIIAQKERLPMNHELRGKSIKPGVTSTQSEGTMTTVPSFKPNARTTQTLPVGMTPPSRPLNLMEKCSTPKPGQMTRPLSDTTKNTTRGQQYTLDNLLVQLLKWNPVWLKEQEKCQGPPPDIEQENPLLPLSEAYSKFDDYIQLFTPHILMETWETAVCGYKERVISGEPKHRVHLSAVQPSADKRFLHYTWNGVVTGHKFSTNQYLCDEDLIIFNYVSEECDPTKPGAPLCHIQRSTFGFLERVTHHKPQDVPRLYNDLPLLRKDAQALGNQQVATVKLKLKIRNRNLRTAPQPATLQRVVSLIPIVRQYNALVELHRNILWRHILDPGRQDVFAEKQPVTDTLRTQLRGYNPSQQRAICTAAKVATQPANLPRICLLQGPPGTGKSHTIVGIIDKIIRDTNGQGRICLCTPSNAAVDEIIRRLIQHKMRMSRDQSQLPFGLRMVRIGKTSSVHKDVAKYTFHEIVHRHVQNEVSRKLEKSIPESSRRELDSLTQKISALSSKLEHIAPGDTNSVHKRRLQADLQKLEQKKADLKYQFSNINRNTSLTAAEEYEIKKNVLWRAHVICGTLNSFGSGSIQSLLRTRHPGDQSSFFFNCVIMDEASQGTELDCLVPLQYGTSKLIMVGDPEQLSPTVLSKKAEEKCFGQSMFERMYGYYKYKDSSPVILLDTQYRMNPEIAAFPSQYVYGGSLLSDKCVMERGNNFPLKPYLVFNIDEGQEQSSQAGSIKNEAEARFVAILCQHIIRHTDIPQTDIGIISPYQRQKSLLVEYLKQSKMTSIEVGTVDGFQGREKEVIIMSCVRASSSGGIGFVGNRKRMNVALTRARSAMYVVGNLRSLERPKQDWQVLISDAKKRSVIIECGSQTNYSTTVKACFKRFPT
ncbi:probable helicase senataxin isoform X2 [Pecten maximus]|uniref:probable helicase senataxin isoform X2 n=1 Tax=Pecten maximus TaxID=6579 RepID=UPI00145806D9|nr:probable helicase senataxin isoform X2 [Pecten maximus]